MPPLPVEALPRHLRALKGAVRAWHLLAAHVWLRLAASLRQAHGADLSEDRFTDDPDLPRTFPEACALFQGALRELGEFNPVPPDFPWLWCGAPSLTASGAPPDLDAWLDSFAGVSPDE